MGYTSWSDEVYSARNKTLRSKGYTDSFTHTADVKSGKVKNKLHDSLDIKGKDRESRDSDEHPNSNAVSVLFDVTGSMSKIPKVLQTKLAKLMSMLLVKGYLSDPQVMFGGIGDATCDITPIQIGQYESGVEMDECLGNIYLEGGGGGQLTESYELSLYYMANHVNMDCLEKRGDKGYLFLIGDEMPYDFVKKHEVTKHIGDTPQSNISLDDLFSTLREKYHLYFIVPTDAWHGKDDRVRNKWRELVGQNLLLLDNQDLVSELIVSTIGINEGVVDVDGIRTDLDNADNEVNTVVKALSTVTRSKELSNATSNRELATSSGGVESL